VTVGEDFLMAKWDIVTRRQVNHTHMEFQSKIVQYNNAGTQLAVGCKNGKCLIFADPKVGQRWGKPLARIGDKERRTKEISVVQFSPSDRYMAVGAHDSRICIYNGKDNYNFIAKCTGHHSTITSLDFSVDGQFLHSTCSGYELLYWTAHDGKQVTSGASTYRDEKWATWQTTLGWPVQGIWPPCSDGSDINSVDRSSSKALIATADDFGKVKLFKYPQPTEKASFQRFIGHSSHVTNVRFSFKDTHVISTGGNDKAIFQWTLRANNDAPVEYDNDGFDESEFNYDKDAAEGALRDGKGSAGVKPKPAEEMGLFALAEEDTGDQVMAILPFKGQVDHSTPDEHKDGNP
jgi:microtubule-associated protein-like 6